MDNKSNTDRRGSWTISATANPLIQTNGAPLIAVECLTSTALTVTVQGDFGSGTVRNMRSWLLSSTATETSIDPGTTSATLAAQDVLLIPTCGAQSIQITRQAGSGTLASAAYATDGVTFWAVSKLIDAGITVTLDEFPAAETPADSLTNATATTRVNSLGYVFDGTTWARARGDSTYGGSAEMTGMSAYSVISTAAALSASIKASAGRVYAIFVFSLDATPVYVRLYNQTTAPASTDTPVLRAAVPSNATAANGAGTNMTFAGGMAFSTGVGIRATTGIADSDVGALTANEVLFIVLYK